MFHFSLRDSRCLHAPAASSSRGVNGPGRPGSRLFSHELSAALLVFVLILFQTHVVSGSVSHFGHFHYRRNRYDGLVTFTAVGSKWKIKEIELMDEKRLL
jgi:hypothetical protein